MPGIGVGFIPKVLNRDILDAIVAVEDDEAFAACRRLARTEGIMAGVSAGAALHAAHQEAADQQRPGRTIVVFLADTGRAIFEQRAFRSLAFPRDLDLHGK